MMPIPKTKKNDIGLLTSAEDLAAKKAKEKRDLRLNFLIHDISRLQFRFFDELMHPTGVTRPEWMVVIFLARQEGVTQTELAAILDISRVNLGTLLDSLETSGFVQRLPHPTDGRAKRAFLTAKGKRLVRKINSRQEQFASVMFERIDEPERDTLVDLLGRLRTTLRALNLKTGDDDPD